ncbi:signal peptidase II [Vallitalea guaymasensis]|uniref:Lipoprotein signal peptidase n=2 Tax=Vallitalea guaymasensis TaxID=1185412 RepID=A0A8J8SED0_9FIRM|nr:signal peptidase II [Vallitalea guaymasensis]QUH31584.1 signal peptidase II [Vallitalea guaymasensis]
MIVMLISVILLISLDQFTKYLTVLNIPERTYIPILNDVFGLTYVKNNGAAFGMLQEQIWLFIIFTTIILIGIFYFYAKIPKEKRYYPIRFTMILFIAGAIGNFVDRIRLRYVVDMLYFKLIDFPVFNMADCYVVVGAILLIALMIFKYKDEDFAFMKRSTK